MTERVGMAVNVVCNSRDIKNELLGKRLDRLSFQEGNGKWEDMHRINVLILCMPEDDVRLAAYDYAEFDLVLVTGDADLFRAEPTALAKVIYMPDHAACLNFFLFLYASYNSDHLVGYDVFSDLLPIANFVVRDIYTHSYDELVAFVRQWDGKFTGQQALVLASQDCDYSNGFSFTNRVFELLDECAGREFAAIVAENYNENGKQRYYQGFVCNLKDEKGRNNDGDCR